MRKIREDDLAYIIGEWYLKWKHNIVDGDVCHKLGIAKEDLKKDIDKVLTAQEGGKNYHVKKI